MAVLKNIAVAAGVAAVLAVGPTLGEVAYAAPSTPPAWPYTGNDKPVVGLSSSTPQEGSTLLISGTGFAPNTTYQLYLHSSPYLLGSARSDKSGNLNAAVKLPTGSKFDGEHQILIELQGKVVSRTNVRIVAPNSTHNGNGGNGNGNTGLGVAAISTTSAATPGSTSHGKATTPAATSSSDLGVDAISTTAASSPTPAPSSSAPLLKVQAASDDTSTPTGAIAGGSIAALVLIIGGVLLGRSRSRRSRGA